MTPFLLFWLVSAGVVDAPADSLVLSVSESVADVEYRSDHAPDAMAFVQAVGAVDRLIVTMAPAAPVGVVAEVMAAARDAGAKRVEVREAASDDAVVAGGARVRAEALSDGQLGALEPWWPAAPEVTVRLSGDVSYGRVARIQALLTDLGVPRVTVRADEGEAAGQGG